MANNMLPPLVGVLRGNIAHFAASMGEARAVAAETSSKTSAIFRGMAEVGKAAFLGIGGAALLIGGVSLHMAGDFQQSMTQLVTGAGESRANIGLVSSGIKDMAGEVGVSAQEIAKGMYTVESAGYHGAAGLTVMKSAAEGAKVGGADMATVADALTTALNAYHMSGDAANNVTNDLIATVASGKMHMQDLAGSLGTVLPAASTAGVSISEVSAAIATMTMQGTPAADAATYLRQTILQMENPSAKAQKALKDVGLSGRQLAEDLGKKGLAATLQEATDAIGKKFVPGSSEYISHLADMVGGTKSMQAALELTGENMPVFVANSKAIGAAAAGGGKEVAGWGDVQKDFNFQIEQAKAGAGALAITIGTMLIPYVSKAMTVTGQIISYFKQHKDQAMILGAAIGGPLLVAIAAYTVSMIAAAVATVAATWPILLVVAAVALLSAGAYLLVSHWSEVVGFFGGIWSRITGTIFGAIQGIITKFVDWAGWSRDLVPETFGQIPETLRAIFGIILGNVGGFFSHLGSSASHAWQEFASRPIYWITFILAFVPAKLAQLSIQAAQHLAHMVVDAIKWAADMRAHAIAMAVGFLAAVMSELPKLPGQAWAVFVQVITSVGQWEDSMIAKGKALVTNFAASFVTEMELLPGQLLTVGEDVIKGLIQGFTNMKDAAGNALHQVVQGAIDGVKDAFGIHSPSTWMIEHVGKPLGQGVTVGVLGQMGSATSAMRSLVGATAGASTGVSVSASSSGGSTASSSGVEDLLQRVAQSTSSVSLASNYQLRQLVDLLTQQNRILMQMVNKKTGLSAALGV